MRMQRFASLIVPLLLLATSPLYAQNDMAGSRDHPEIPRIQGTTIVGYAYSDHDLGDFITAFQNRELQTNNIGGKRTQIFYLAPNSLNLVQVFKNYGTALGELGETKLIYACDTNCAGNLGFVHVWPKRKRIKTNLQGSDSIYGPDNIPFYARDAVNDQGYTYLTVTNETARYHISIYSALLTGHQVKSVANLRSIHIDIVEEADFVSTLEVVTPEEITQGIAEKGRIALYGIHFDFDSDVLKTDSGPAIDSIATALKNNTSLVVYVVGHTDNQGEYAYNLSLSNRRAAAVVKNLTDEHGISKTRLIPVGVGPVAPVASNQTEDGQALNRRVELVEF